MTVIPIDRVYYIRDSINMYVEYHRKAMRCSTHNYSSNAKYFITACCQNRQPLFGYIKNHNLILNPAGKMIHKWWQKIPDKFLGASVDEFIVMPDHIHGIISITNDHVGSDKRTGMDEPTGMDDHVGSSLREIVGWFKTMTTNEYIRNVKNNGWRYFDGKLWQRSYYDRIVRNNYEYLTIKKYIKNNPNHHN